MKAKYKTLGLKKGASQEEIQEAYERLSKELDPVANNNETFFVEKFAKVKAAYSALLTKKDHDEDEIPVKELNWFLKLFTIGDKFSFRDFFDRAKKMLVEFFAIFFGVFLSLAVDQKREDSNHRDDNINNMSDTSNNQQTYIYIYIYRY